MAVKNFGRYVVLEKLGAGAQGTVYLCRDPELERRVAVKWLNRLGGAHSVASPARLQEARMMGRLQHTNIVTIHDVGEEDRNPFFVFEFVEGELLCDVLKNGPLGLTTALNHLEGVLEGVAEAHRSGVVHRDLKPANVMIGKDGVPKVMDFGIARAVGEDRGGHAKRIGTPGYLAPEYIREGRVGTQMDVFSLGVIMYEMVCGKPAFRGDSAEQIFDEVLSRKLPALREMDHKVDDRLDAIVMRAVEKSPDARFATAVEMLEALQAYRKSAGEKTYAAMASGGATVEFLVRRIQRNSDFPALSTAITALNRFVASDDEDISCLSDLIIKDYGLTNKILKVVNSAYYNRFSGNVGTISRAVIVLGTKAIRSIAASLIFFEHLHDRVHAQQLRDRVAASLFSAIFARRFANGKCKEDAEEYLLSAMFHRLGELLVTYYLPDEAREIERLVTQEAMSAPKAQREVLGTSYQDIGTQIAREWNFPERTIQSMRSLVGHDVPDDRSGTRAHAIVANFANEVVDALQQPDSGPTLDGVLDRYQRALEMDRKELDTLLKAATDEFLGVISEWGVGQTKGSLVARIAQRGKGPGKEDGDGGENAAESSRELQEADASTALDSEVVLTNGLQEVTGLLLERRSLTQIFNVALETMYRGMDFGRVVLALRDPKTGEMAAKLGFGPDIKRFMGDFKFSSQYVADVFHVALRDNVDIHLSDTRAEKVRQQLPSWYRRLTACGSLLLFPLVVNGRALGLIYGDHPSPGGLEVTASRLNLLKALRNQAAMAIQSAMSANPSG